MAKEHNIKRSITIYSWNRQVEAGTMTWEDCIKAAVKLGCNGIELLGQLYFRYCPEALEEDIDSWNELMWKYGTKTVAHDFFVDKTLFNHRNLTVKEGVDIVRRHAEFARSIGCPVMRIGGQVDPEVFRQSIPYLEKNKVKMGLEIHSGSSSFVLDSVQKVIDVIRTEGSKYIGIVPDMSMFCKEISQRQINSALSTGIDPELVKKTVELYKEVDNVKFREFCNAELEKASDDMTKRFLAMVRRTEYFDPKVLEEHMDYTVHVHGKFYEMNDDCEETTIDYPGVLEVFKNSNYQGYISAEYEGAPINGDTLEPFRRYEKMLDKYLGTYPDANYPEWPEAKPVNIKSVGMTSQAVAPEGFKNHYEDGKCTGFEVKVHNFYYRGVPLALFESCYVTIDGKMYGPESMHVAVDGECFKFEDMCDVTLHYWNKGELATIIIDEPGGLVPGKEYEVSAVANVRAYYMREGIAAFTGGEVVMPPAEKMTLEA
ncbi:MAG: TIM barrel protein [Lachnospiraceae bacterium]|nr:TIM barrel protein [Lachnospiraceae bacterium]